MKLDIQKYTRLSYGILEGHRDVNTSQTIMIHLDNTTLTAIGLEWFT